MRSAFAPIALAALAAANPMPQGVTSAITPDTSAPAGCSPDYSGEFQIQVVNVTSSSSKRSYQKRQSGTLELKLAGGILTDSQGRTGYIAANRQFQFDAPAQTGAVYTAGWSVCPNGTLAIGGDAIFQQCLSGTFYNLYDEADSAQCTPVYIDVIGGGSGGGASVQPDGQPTETPVASQIPDGQVTASAVSSAAPVTQITDGQIQASTAAAPVTQISDGQIQATTAVTPVSVIPDGQPQAPTGSPVSQIPDGQPQAPTGSAVQQISDGQIQATTGAPVSQISDGQIQASTGAAPVTQISDGQIQAPTGSPVTQISDGQIQAPTGSPVTQISDGQIQAPTGSPVTQISDGQIQAPTNGSSYASPTVQPYTGAGAVSSVRSELFGLAAGILAVAML